MKTIALIGNPNVGKTTLFNALTGSKQKVGNWAGVTVDKKEAFLENTKIVDLPGIYAMDTFSNEEKVSKHFLQNEQVDLILNIVDASNIERNLYLTMQLKQFNKPIVLLVNMIDVAEKKNIFLNFNALEKQFKVKVIPISASKRKGLDVVQDFIKNTNDFSKYLDNSVYEFKNENEVYKFIDTNLKSSYKKNGSNLSLTDKIDNIALNPWLSYPIFFAIIVLIFLFTFAWVGQPLADKLTDFLTGSIPDYITSTILANASPWFTSLVVDGIIGGVGSIIGFLPLIVSLYFCIFLLEESGYMARVAFLMDGIMKKMGLSGKAFITMMLGFGCSVPAIGSARTLESEKDRKLAGLLAPLMSCNAKLPIYALFVSVFFRGHEALAISSIYILGVVIAFIVGTLFSKTVFKKDTEPFVVELPEYKIPTVTSMVKQIWSKTKGFLVKAGTIIFAMSVLIWFLQSFNAHGFTTNIDTSFLKSIGDIFIPFFAPLGFGNWQASVSLLTGLMAKETVLSTMQVIYPGELHLVLPAYFTTISAYAFLIFVLLYTPCISALGMLKKEFGGKFTIMAACFQIGLAWIVSLLFYNVAMLTTNGGGKMEYIITAIIILFVAFIIFKNLRKSAKGECHCSGCTSQCGKRQSPSKVKTLK